MTTKVWNLMYAVGNTGRVTGDSSNPQRRAAALAGAATISAQNGWRVWVEHVRTQARIYESPKEQAHQQSLAAQRIVRFAEDNVPGFKKR